MNGALAPTVLAPLTSAPVVRADGIGGRWQSPEMGIGGVPNRVARAIFEPSLQLPASTIDALIQFSGVGRRMCEREPFDGTREGFTLGTDPVAAALCESAHDWTLDRIKLGRTWARGYGGGALVVDADDGRKSTDPIDRLNIRRIRSVRALNRHECVPVRWVEDPSSARLGEPLIYQVTIAGMATAMVHYTRVIRMQGFVLPAVVMRRQQGWGGGVFDLAWASLRNWQLTNECLPEMASRWNQGAFNAKYIDAGVGADLKPQIVQRFEALAAGMSIFNDLILNPGEEYKVIGKPATGVKEVIDALIEAFIADGDMPRVILLGETPGGLTTGSDSPEVTAWYDYVAAVQRAHYTAPLTELLELVALAHDGPTFGEVPRIKVQWRPLYQQSQAEQDASDMSHAQRRSTDITSGAISVAEARTDPTLAKHYRLDPSTMPTPTGEDPTLEEPPLDDEAEMTPVVAADASQIPKGESLVGIRAAAQRLGCGPTVLMRQAAAGAFPIWRVGTRWKVAMSLVEAAHQPHGLQSGANAQGLTM